MSVDIPFNCNWNVALRWVRDQILTARKTLGSEVSEEVTAKGPLEACILRLK